MLNYVVVEYSLERPTPLITNGVTNGVYTPLRMDGHYVCKEDAEEIANMWRQNRAAAGSRVFVVEILRP